MKKLILEKIEKLGGRVSFVELEKIPGFAGDQGFGFATYNIVCWINISDVFMRALHDLIKDEIVVIEAASPWVYLNDGYALDLPLMKRNIKYKSPRWMPVVFNKGPNFYDAYWHVPA